MLTTDTAPVVNWVSHRVDGLFPTVGVAALGWERDGKITAGVVYDHYTGASVTATLVIDDAALNKKFLWAIFDYPFNQLGVKKIIAYVEEANAASLKMLKRMGFIVEGTIKDAHESGAMLVMTLIKDDCIWLKRLNHG